MISLYIQISHFDNNVTHPRFLTATVIKIITTHTMRNNQRLFQNSRVFHVSIFLVIDSIMMIEKIGNIDCIKPVKKAFTYIIGSFLIGVNSLLKKL